MISSDWAVEYPARSARTRRFTLGAPRSFTVGSDGERVVFLRSASGEDPVTSLWVADVGTATERLIADPRELLVDSGSPGSPSDADPDADRRERLRESAEGITSYACDLRATRAVFACSGTVFDADLGGAERGGAPRALPARPGAFDPRPDPSGSTRVAYVADGTVRLLEERDAGSYTDRLLLGGEDDPAVTWGLAEFVAAEEMGRMRGFWWAPDGSALLVARVDSSPVTRWHLADPAAPDRAPREVRYPAAGTPNALVSLVLVPLGAGAEPSPVEGWDSEAFPYLVSVAWDSPELPALLAVQSRDQTVMEVLALDPATQTVTPVHRIVDAQWVEIVPGVPRWADGELLTVSDRDGARRLVRGGVTLTGDDVYVRAVLGVSGGEALVAVSTGTPTTISVVAVDWQGAIREVSIGPGVHGATRGGDTTVVWSSRPTDERQAVRVTSRLGDIPIASHAEHSGALLRAHDLSAGPDDVRTMLVLPSWYQEGRLPVLMCPYGGPHAQLVLDSAASRRNPQWWAEQGYAVVVADGRGTPGRSAVWERAVWRDLAGPVLADQVVALDAAAEHAARNGLAELDLSRVGIRGWSFGGYLSALAVLRRPDRFHAAVAGAPVTDWSLYDTHYTERYLGTPDADPEAYRRSNLLDDAARPVDDDHPARPLMIVHGMVDDNVVVAHSLRLSSALLAGGRPHSVLPVSGVTHFTPQATVAENLMRLEAGFLASALDPRCTPEGARP